MANQQTFRVSGFYVSHRYPNSKRLKILLKEKRDWLNWFVGLVDGEGCFGINRTKTNSKVFEFIIAFHERELPILLEIHKTLKIGHISYMKKTHRSTAGQYRFYVRKRKDLLELIIPIFSKVKLRTPHKKEQFKKWKENLISYEKERREIKKSYRTKVECLNCGKVFERLKHKILSHCFCSRKCYHQYRKGKSQWLRED
ncbi:MAG: LAGLIDADG family homing endonuclease [Candidatus Hydrothermarchaeota archaeon]